MENIDGGDQPVALSRGVRVGVEVPDGGTYVAVIEGIAGHMVDIELLDDVPDGTLVRDGVVNVFLPRGAGLYCWLGRVVGQSGRSSVSLAMVDPVQLRQRRRHVRMAVDLPAVVRCVRGGRRGRAQRVRVADLSSGGMKLVGASTLATVDSVVIDVDLGRGTVSLDGRVVMAYPTPDGNRVAHVALAKEQPWTEELSDAPAAAGIPVSS